jgi:hypothetical protein
MKHYVTALLLLPALLVACPQAPTPEVKPPVLEQPFKPTLLGSLEVQFGGDGKGTVAQFKPNTIQNQTLTPVTESSLVFNNQVFQTIDVPATTNRYLMARFTVTNNVATARTNLTLVAYRKNNNSGGSAFRNVQTFAGGTVDVNNLVPVNAMKTTGCTAPATVCVDNNNADLQIYQRSEITTLTTASNGTLINVNPITGEGILQYAYVARSSATSRTIAANGTGTVTLALQVPQAGDAGNGNSAYRYSMSFLVFTDNVARVTESTSEQGTNSGASARATSFGGSPQIASMCGTSLTGSTFIPGVRTVGVGVDTAWMGGNFFDNGTAANFAGIIGNSEKAYTGANATLTARFSSLGGATLTPQNRAIASATTTNGGNLGIANASTGTVTIRPLVNSRVVDSFNYQISDGTCTSPNFSATLAAPTNTVWYIDSSVASSGDGRSNSPFKTVADYNTANNNQVNDFIYIKGSTGNNTLVLKNNQQVIGSGEALVVGVDTLAAAGIAPTISSPFTVATDNTVKGLTFGGLSGTAGGTLTVSNASIAAGANQAVNITNGTMAVSLTRVASSGGANGIQLTNTTGSFVVTGTGTTAESGGILTGHTADGVNLATQFGSVTLKNMRISNSQNEGVETSPNTGTNLLRLEDVTINNAGSAVATTHDGVLYTASGASSNTLEVIGTVAVTSGNATTVASRIQTGDNSGIRVNTITGSSASMVLKVEKTSIRENAFFGIQTQYQSSGATTTTLDDNRIDLITVDGSGIRIDADTPAQTHKLRIKGNTIDLHLGANTGASAGMDVKVRQAGILQALIETNTVLDAEGAGILVNAGSAISTANLQLSLLSNTATSSDPLPVTGILVKSGISSGTGATVCLNAVSNNINFSDVAANNYLLQRVTTGTNTFNLHGATGTPLTSSATVTSWLSDAPRSNLNTAGKTSILGSATPGYGTCTVTVPTF